MNYSFMVNIEQAIKNKKNKNMHIKKHKKTT